MIIIGNKNIPHIGIQNIETIEDISKTKPNSIVAFTYNINILNYCYANNVNSAVVVSNIKEAIFSNSLSARYIIVDNSIAKKIQKVAENYMFDSKILEIISNDDEIETIAINGIDGVIYKEEIKEI
ncbi:MAG: hypothetical protein KAJ49_07215 [Arcobacteraceae bacterium]|nr:hypothetical protein [Arcobacteraceae bacterium]